MRRGSDTSSRNNDDADVDVWIEVIRKPRGHAEYWSRSVRARLKNHKTYLSVGHDEYWSKAQRANVEAARDAGVNLMFLSGNEAYWKTRYEPSADASHTAYRTLVSYKETWAQAKSDPALATTNAALNENNDQNAQMIALLRELGGTRANGTSASGLGGLRERAHTSLRAQ